MKIICIGRNYSEHAKELNNPIPDEPVFFMKADSSILPNRHPLYIPEWTNDLNYEVELIVKINRLGKYISKKHAHKYYSEIGVGIDFTARDVQAECKKKGLPWEKAKSFDGSAAVSKQFISLEELGDDVQNINFSLKKNGETVQNGFSKDMLFSIEDIIVYLSQFVTLKMGDLIFTGTPAGVGRVDVNDQLDCYIGEQKLLSVRIK